VHEERPEVQKGKQTYLINKNNTINSQYTEKTQYLAKVGDEAYHFPAIMNYVGGHIKINLADQDIFKNYVRNKNNWVASTVDDYLDKIIGHPKDKGVVDLFFRARKAAIQNEKSKWVADIANIQIQEVITTLSEASDVMTLNWKGYGLVSIRYGAVG
jgi:hypothetical protein